MCGENLPSTAKNAWHRGSPPRVRGKHSRRAICRRRIRITPACAGKTEYMFGDEVFKEDHPRVCGENRISSLEMNFCRGSPPRVRGKLQSCGENRVPARITPACAGKTKLGFYWKIYGEDHPRVCGENDKAARIMPVQPGSPPRVRGKRFSNLRLEAKDRITPACAGKTTLASSISCFTQDHPRVCGENGFSMTLAILKRGSPPRVRGKPFARSRLLFVFGITPACAGKTNPELRYSRGEEDHPRVCGENTDSPNPQTPQPGSPPRVRGTPRIFSMGVAPPGITPACAGKTLRKWRISVVDPSPQPRSSLTSRKADASIGSQRAPCAAPV